MDFGYIFVPRLHITHNNFPGDWINRCTAIASIYPKTVFWKCEGKLRKEKKNYLCNNCFV